MKDALTPREKQVWRLREAGASFKQIAGRLVISTETVKTHMRHIREKAGMSDCPFCHRPLSLKWEDLP